MRVMTDVAIAMLVAVVPSVGWSADATLPAFDPAGFAVPMANPYFPLKPGVVRHMRGTTQADDGKLLPFERVRTVTGLGPVILGVQTITILDEEFEDGRVTESSQDYFATDATGAAWYFGEDVIQYSYDEKGALIEKKAGANWKAGTNGAKPGIMIRMEPVAGETLFRAHAPADNEMEFSRVTGADETLTVPAGPYQHTVRLYTESTTDPELRDNTWWAKDIGLIRVEEDLSPAGDAPKVIAELVK